MLHTCFVSITDRATDSLSGVSSVRPKPWFSASVSICNSLYWNLVKPVGLCVICPELTVDLWLTPGCCVDNLKRQHEISRLGSFILIFQRELASCTSLRDNHRIKGSQFIWKAKKKNLTKKMRCFQKIEFCKSLYIFYRYRFRNIHTAKFVSNIMYISSKTTCSIWCTIRAYNPHTNRRQAAQWEFKVNHFPRNLVIYNENINITSKSRKNSKSGKKQQKTTGNSCETAT